VRWPVALIILCVLFGIPVNPAFGQGGDVAITVDQFGVGDSYRPGSFTGLRLTVESLAQGSLEAATSAWVQWEVSNSDGDIVEYGRPVTLTRGRPLNVWLYAPLPPQTDDRSLFVVRVLEMVDGVRGRELGAARIAPPASGLVEAHSSMLLVAGSSQVGLNQYALPNAPTGGTRAATAHENTRVVFGLGASDLPDLWLGLDAFEAIVWTTAVPQEARPDQAAALMEWVRRGGHLVIVLGEDGNPWGIADETRTEFAGMLPARAPRRDEGATIRDFVPILSRSRGSVTASRAPFRLAVFRDGATGFDSIDPPYSPFLTMPDGRVIAVQRLMGFGRVTIIGIDLSRSELNSLLLRGNVLTALPHADAFWNRILGRRADTPQPSELAALAAAERWNASGGSVYSIGDSRVFQSQTNLSGQAGRGLLAALGLFVAYWIVAGPGGFVVLRSRGLVRHSWLAFVGATAVFTVLAWGAVALLRDDTPLAQHLTILDHIARPTGSPERSEDPQLQRVTSWLSVYTPGYQSASLALEDGAAAEGRGDVLCSWSPPAIGASVFPNSSRFTVDVRRGMTGFDQPARSTATRLQLRWLGPMGAGDSGRIGVSPEAPVQVRVENNREVLSGALINGHSEALHNVTIIWVQSRRFPSARYQRAGDSEELWVSMAESGAMPCVASMWRLADGPAGWAPGSRIDLTPPAASVATTALYERYFRNWAGDRGLAFNPSDLRRDDVRTLLEMLSMFHQLHPPPYQRSPRAPEAVEGVQFIRPMGRELDLSPWFSRPCLIVIGYLDEGPLPAPLTMNGEEIRSDGQTMVRWILPMPLIESVAFAAPEPPPSESEDP